MPWNEFLSETLHTNLLVSIKRRAFKEFWGCSRLQPGNRGQEAKIYRAVSMPLNGGMTVLPLPKDAHQPQQSILLQRRTPLAFKKKGLKATTAFLMSSCTSPSNPESHRPEHFGSLLGSLFTQIIIENFRQQQRYQGQLRKPCDLIPSPLSLDNYWLPF